MTFRQDLKVLSDPDLKVTLHFQIGI